MFLSENPKNISNIGEWRHEFTRKYKSCGKGA
jgi:hypothetical protein